MDIFLPLRSEIGIGSGRVGNDEIKKSFAAEFELIGDMIFRRYVFHSLFYHRHFENRLEADLKQNHWINYKSHEKTDR